EPEADVYRSGTALLYWLGVSAWLLGGGGRLRGDASAPRRSRRSRPLPGGAVMSGEPLDALLEKLNSGDGAAAQQVDRSYEPYLRMVAGGQLSRALRAKCDSRDVVQSVWVHMLKGFREAGWRFADTTHLRAFLTRLTRHRFIDRLRRHKG